MPHVFDCHVWASHVCSWKRLCIITCGIASYNIMRRLPQAGTALINGYGQDGSFLAPCEAAVAAAPVAGEDVRRADWRRQGAVVFLGAAATHIDPSDPKVVSVAKSLSQALSVPSEAVQRAISDCLAPLCKVRDLHVWQWHWVRSTQLGNGHVWLSVTFWSLAYILAKFKFTVMRPVLTVMHLVLALQATALKESGGGLLKDLLERYVHRGLWDRHAHQREPLACATALHVS
jgi:hypothetical protein